MSPASVWLSPASVWSHRELWSDCTIDFVPLGGGRLGFIFQPATSSGKGESSSKGHKYKELANNPAKAKPYVCTGPVKEIWAGHQHHLLRNPEIQRQYLGRAKRGATHYESCHPSNCLESVQEVNDLTSTRWLSTAEKPRAGGVILQARLKAHFPGTGLPVPCSLGRGQFHPPSAREPSGLRVNLRHRTWAIKTGRHPQPFNWQHSSNFLWCLLCSPYKVSRFTFQISLCALNVPQGCG